MNKDQTLWMYVFCVYFCAYLDEDTTVVVLQLGYQQLRNRTVKTNKYSYIFFLNNDGFRSKIEYR